MQKLKKTKSIMIIFNVFILLFDKKAYFSSTKIYLMENYEEKLALLIEMIAFSVVDGKLHDREYLFLSMIADELEVSKEDFRSLFHQEHNSIVIKSEFERIQQFYRLALLMYIDGELHVKEHIKINEIGINMGLNPHAIKRVLKAMEQSPNKMISPKFLLEVFQEQLN
jgi:uncharacterized tellurite resistance protein B-like protein